MEAPKYGSVFSLYKGQDEGIYVSIYACYSHAERRIPVEFTMLHCSWCLFYMLAYRKHLATRLAHLGSDIITSYTTLTSVVWKRYTTQPYSSCSWYPNKTTNLGFYPLGKLPLPYVSPSNGHLCDNSIKTPRSLDDLAFEGCHPFVYSKLSSVSQLSTISNQGSYAEALPLKLTHAD